MITGLPPKSLALQGREETRLCLLQTYSDNLLSVVFYGTHLKGLNEIDVLVIIDKPYDLIKLNRVADFIENIKEPIGKEYVRAHEIAYDRGNYFQNLVREMLNPERTIEYVKYISTVEYISPDEDESGGR